MHLDETRGFGEDGLINARLFVLRSLARESSGDLLEMSLDSLGKRSVGRIMRKYPFKIELNTKNALI